MTIIAQRTGWHKQNYIVANSILNEMIWYYGDQTIQLKGIELFSWIKKNKIRPNYILSIKDRLTYNLCLNRYFPIPVMKLEAFLFLTNVLDTRVQLNF